MAPLKYTECEIDTTKLVSSQEEFEALHAKISGRSQGYKSITKPAGDEFSDLIGAGLQELAEKNHSSWKDALMACTHAFGVLGKAVKDVDWYNDEIRRIKGNLTSALNALPITQQTDSDAVRKKTTPFNGLAREAWTKLEARCEETEDILKDGPIPRRIRQLAEGGYFGRNEQIGYQTTKDIDFYVIDKGFNTDLVTVHLYEAVVNGREGSLQMLETDPRILALLGSMFRRAEDARRNGEKLSKAELAFLEGIYRTLSYDGDGKKPGFLEFVDKVNDSEHIEDGMRLDIKRALANGMLVLSDEKVGGGMARLPADVRDAADGPEMMPISELTDENSDDYMDDYREWGGKFATLADFLGASDGRVKGGTEFSTTLLGTTVKNAGLVQFYGREPNLEDYQSVVEVATRNEEANHILLTGKDFDGNEYEHHENHAGMTPTSALRTLYTIDWEDDGKAVRGLTDWIARDADSGSEVARERAGEAAEALVDILTTADDKGKNPFLDTPVGGKDYDRSVAEINHQVLLGLASVYEAYLDDFSIDTDEFGYKKLDGSRDDLYLFHENGDRALLLPQDRHKTFLQLLLSNEEYSAPIVSMVEVQERRILDTYLEHTQLGHQVGGRAAADLRSTMANALIQEFTDRTGDVEKAREKANQMVQTGYNILIANTVQATGAKATPAGMALETFLRLMEQPTKDYAAGKIDEKINFKYIENMDQHLLGDQAQIRDHVNLQILDAMYQRGLVDEKTLDEAGLLVDDGDGGKRLPTAAAEWKTARDGMTSAVETTIEEVDPKYRDLAENYVENFQERYKHGLDDAWVVKETNEKKK